MKIIKCAVVGLLVAMSASLHAGFTYTETTQITGGSMLGLMKMAARTVNEANCAVPSGFKLVQIESKN